MTQFEKGAVFALEILKEVVARRYAALGKADEAARQAGDGDLYQVLGGVKNVVAGLRSEFESKLLPGLREAQQGEPSAEARDELLRTLHDIRDQATRKKRASGVKKLLEGDLEIIESRVNSALLLLEKV